MGLKIFFLALTLVVLSYSQASNQLIAVLKEQAAKIAQSMPSGYDQLVVAINTNGLDGYDACTAASFNTMISKYNFSSDIVQNFQMITFSESLEFQAFHVSVTQDYADIIEFIGAGANIGGNIQIAFLQVYAEGTPYPEIQFTQAQLNIITDALRASAYAKVQQFLETPPQRITNYQQRETYLLDQNAWALKMTSYGECFIEDGSPCEQLLYAAVTEKCNNFASTDYDDRDACVLPYIPQNSYWNPCFLCLCAYIFYAHNPYLPNANAKCFSIEYPGVTDIYDPIGLKPGDLTNIHYWNETDY